MFGGEELPDGLYKHFLRVADSEIEADSFEYKTFETDDKFRGPNKALER